MNDLNRSIGKLRQEDHEFKTGLQRRSSLKANTKEKKCGHHLEMLLISSLFPKAPGQKLRGLSYITREKMYLRQIAKEASVQHAMWTDTH